LYVLLCIYLFIVFFLLSNGIHHLNLLQSFAELVEISVNGKIYSGD